MSIIRYLQYNNQKKNLLLTLLKNLNENKTKHLSSVPDLNKVGKRRQ